MGFVRCELPHPVFLVTPEICLAKARKDYDGLSLPKSAADIEQDFLSFIDGGIFTLVDDRQPENLRVSFCTARYELICGLSKQKDVYIAQRLAPLSLRTHNLITQGAVLVSPHTWAVFAELTEFNRQVYSETGEKLVPLLNTGIDALTSCWEQARQPGKIGQTLEFKDSALTTAQVSFLANVDTLIDFACQVELDQAARQERIPVKAVELVAADRFGSNTYRFQLGTMAEIRLGEYLQTGRGETSVNGINFDGVVIESTGHHLTLRFRQPVDLKQLENVEWLLPKFSTRQYSIQHSAVNALRNGQALNPALLPLIVEDVFERFPPPIIPDRGEYPNPAQKMVIERALVVPDLLLAHGPPGTGKTHTIREIVARQAAMGKKVLVTSKNNKAVDNVLEGLGHVQALRIGREEAVSADVRPLLIDNAAADFRQNLLAGIQPVQANLDGLERIWPQIQQVLDRLAQLAVVWRQSQIAIEREQSSLYRWQRNAYTRVKRSLERQINHYQQLTLRLKQAAQRAEGLKRRLEVLHALSQFVLLGPFFTLLAEHFAGEWDEASREYHGTQQEVRQSRQSIRKIWETYFQFVTASEQALQLKGFVLQAEDALEDVHTQIVQAKAELTLLTEALSLLNGAMMERPPLRLDSPEQIETSLSDWLVWYELMMCRRGLLSEWQNLLQTRPQVLHSALVRGADVIGATCIGIATDVRFEDLEFDLVIADEAGQIQVMDLLVPLVRARRAVLVGDHLQLPPVVEPEIIQKIRENEPENQELGSWLGKSLFERLIENPLTPENNRVMLDTQYRMPVQIADFISTQFYAGRYHTDDSLPEHTDPFFTGSPMVFVDTSREVRHYEQRAEDGQGYFNSLEAKLICDLLMAYQAKGSQAGVIVPYRKQAEVIRRELRKRQAGLNENELIARVATVDSYQGREVDVVIFGFTRSNAEGRIGFLTELRRLNVSLTRARRQLILVGDSVTLSETADQEFAALVKSLLNTIKKLPKGYFHANELSRFIQP